MTPILGTSLSVSSAPLFRVIPSEASESLFRACEKKAGAGSVFQSREVVDGNAEKARKRHKFRERGLAPPDLP